MRHHGGAGTSPPVIYTSSWRFILAPCVLWHTFDWRLSDSGTPCPVSTLIAAWRGILAHAVRRGVGSTSDTKGSIELWARQQQYVLLYKHLCTAPTRFASFNPLLRPTCEVDLPPHHLIPLKLKQLPTDRSADRSTGPISLINHLLSEVINFGRI